MKKLMFTVIRALYLFWSMELWATHDNEPLSANAEKTDYGIIISVVWAY